MIKKDIRKNIECKIEEIKELNQIVADYINFDKKADINANMYELTRLQGAMVVTINDINTKLNYILKQLEERE